jgi:hypothetical protein
LTTDGSYVWHKRPTGIPGFGTTTWIKVLDQNNKQLVHREPNDWYSYGVWKRSIIGNVIDGATTFAENGQNLFTSFQNVRTGVQRGVANIAQLFTGTVSSDASERLLPSSGGVSNGTFLEEQKTPEVANEHEHKEPDRNVPSQPSISYTFDRTLVIKELSRIADKFVGHFQSNMSLPYFKCSRGLEIGWKEIPISRPLAAVLAGSTTAGVIWRYFPVVEWLRYVRMGVHGLSILYGTYIQYRWKDDDTIPNLAKAPLLVVNASCLFVGTMLFTYQILGPRTFDSFCVAALPCALLVEHCVKFVINKGTKREYSVTPNLQRSDSINSITHRRKNDLV